MSALYEDKIKNVGNAGKSDLFDVLEYVSFVRQPVAREVRVAKAQSKIFISLSTEQKQFSGIRPIQIHRNRRRRTRPGKPARIAQVEVFRLG